MAIPTRAESASTRAGGQDDAALIPASADDGAGHVLRTGQRCAPDQMLVIQDPVRCSLHLRRCVKCQFGLSSRSCSQRTHDEDEV